MKSEGTWFYQSCHILQVPCSARFLWNFYHHARQHIVHKGWIQRACIWFFFLREQPPAKDVAIVEDKIFSSRWVLFRFAFKLKTPLKLNSDSLEPEKYGIVSDTSRKIESTSVENCCRQVRFQKWRTVFPGLIGYFLKIVLPLVYKMQS